MDGWMDGWMDGLMGEEGAVAVPACKGKTQVPGLRFYHSHERSRSYRKTGCELNAYWLRTQCL